MHMGKESRVKHLMNELQDLKCVKSVVALNMMLNTMNAKNGYARKDGSHYYYHLVDATQDLINHGIKDDITLCACILHDAEEDIPEWTFEHIANMFGGDVAKIVHGVTKQKGIDYKQGENLHNYLQAMLDDVRMCLVKTADRKHNFSTLYATSRKHELRQANETQEYFMPFFKEARKRYPRYSAYFHSAKTSIMPHLKRILKAEEDEQKLKDRISQLEYKLEQERLHRKALEKKMRGV